LKARKIPTNTEKGEKEKEKERETSENKFVG
jgi:hypothetical protein